MKHKMKIGLLLLTVMAMVLVPGASAYRTYVPSVASSCSVCHVNPEGGLPLNAVGEIYRDTGSLPPTTSNKAPVADDQSVTTPAGTPGVVTLTAIDPDGNSLTFAVVSNPTNGKLSGTAPSLTYTPNTGYSGADSFTYKANDGKLDSNIAKVSITVASASVNKAPVADDQAVTIPAGTPGAVTLTAIDPDGNSLTFAAVSNPTNGKLSGTAPSLTYTPNTGYSGADSFTYKANDGKLDSNVAKVSITVTSESTNPPPVPTEKATVKFVVTDDKKGNPIKNAKVSLGKITIKTDKTGMAIFTNVVPGSYNYEISKDHDLETKDSISVTGDQIISVKLISDEEEHDQKEHHEEVKNKKSTTQSRYNRGLKNEENDHEEE